MAWNYLSTAPNSSDRSWIRLRIGDTSSGDQLLQDEEIEAHLTAEGNRYTAAALCAESVGSWFARRVDKTVGRMRIAAQQASERYFDLADRLRVELATRVTPYAGGISVSDKEADEAAGDRVRPGFSVQMFEFPGGVEPGGTVRHDDDSTYVIT